MFAALVIGVAETWVAATLPIDLGRHRVDALLTRLAAHEPWHPIVVFGDSVTNGALRAVEVPDDMLDLTSNGAIGFAGVFFLYRRLLEGTPPPRFLVLVDIPESWGTDLTEPYAEAYFETTFLRRAEIADYLATSERPLQCLRMVMHRLLLPPSFHARGVIRRHLGLLPGELALDQGAGPRDRHDIPASVALALDARRRQVEFAFPPLQQRYLRKLADGAATTGTQLVLVTGALPRSVLAAWRTNGYLAQYQRALALFALAGSNVVVDPAAAFATFDDADMFDAIHLEPTPRDAYGRALVARLRALFGPAPVSPDRAS